MAGLRTDKRRRHENKTDYKQRLGLLKSGLPRIVIRRTNRYFSLQLVESDAAQDSVIKSVSSRDLLKEGLDDCCKNSLKSTPAAYLTGLLFAKSLDKEKRYVTDIGMSRNIHKNRVFAVLKGLVDGGVNIKVDEGSFPTEDRIDAEHLAPKRKEAFAKLKEKLS